MEGRGGRRSSARKPLSDRTNTTALPPRYPRRNIPSPAPLKPHSAGISPTPVNKTSHFTPSKKIRNPKISENVNQNNISNGEKSHTSTGSNNSPLFDSVSSTPPALVQSDKARRAAAKIHKHDKQTRKDKEKLFGTARVIQDSTLLTSEATKLSSVVSGSGGCDSRLAADEIQKLNEQKMKDKGKMVVETPMINISVPFTSDRLPASSAASGNLYLPGPSTIHNQRLGAQASKDNRQMVQVTPNNEQSDPRTPPPHILSSPAASGTDDLEKRYSVVYKQRRSSRRKMHTDPSINLLLSCPLDKRMMNKRIEHNDGAAHKHAGSRTDPFPVSKKKRSLNKCDESIHAMPREEVQKLKAYFEDVDAFELPVEDASESELE